MSIFSKSPVSIFDGNRENSLHARLLNMEKPVGFRADREPDASWHRPSNHRSPSADEQWEERLNQKNLEREMRQAEERDAQERARLRRREENRLREEERIRKMKNSLYFIIQRIGRKEEDILKQMENEDDSDYRPLLPYAPLKEQY